MEHQIHLVSGLDRDLRVTQLPSQYSVLVLRAYTRATLVVERICLHREFHSQCRLRPRPISTYSFCSDQLLVPGPMDSAPRPPYQILTPIVSVPTPRGRAEELGSPRVPRPGTSQYVLHFSFSPRIALPKMLIYPWHAAWIIMRNWRTSRSTGEPPKFLLIRNSGRGVVRG